MSVLLVDSNEITLNIERIMLLSSGLIVETATNSDKARNLASNNKYAMVFIDIESPKIDANALAVSIREIDEKVPIIALTTHESILNLPEFLSPCINGTLKKPIKVKELRKLVSAYFGIEHNELFKWRRARDILFNYDEFIDMVGDLESAQHILYRFLTEHEKDRKNIHESVEKKDYNTAIEILQDIVGICGNLSCYRLHDIAGVLVAELGLKRFDKMYIFDNVWNDTLLAIAERYQIMRETTNSDSGVIESVNWESLLREFVAYAGEFDSETTYLFNRHIALFSEKLPRELFEKLKGEVNRYNYLEVQKLMEEYQNV